MTTLTPPWWVYIQRQYDADLALGPYPNEPVAKKAMEESALVDVLCQEDCLDCWTDQGEPEADFERIYVDLTDADHTGNEPMSDEERFAAVGIAIRAPEPPHEHGCTNCVWHAYDAQFQDLDGGDASLIIGSHIHPVGNYPGRVAYVRRVEREEKS